MESLTFQEWGIISSISISITSIGLHIYKDFIQGSKLKTIFNTIVFVKIPEINKNEILLQIILDDMLSERPSEQASKIINSNPDLKNAINNRSRELMKNCLISYSIELTSKGQSPLIYDANPESIVKYFGDNNFILSFYTPLNIINIGRKTGDITTIILQLTSTIDPSKKWIYSCFNEIKPDEITNFKNLKEPIGGLFGKLFPGISIGPNNNQRLDLFLIPITTSKDRAISNSGLIPGKYKAKIFGYNSINLKCLESNEGILSIDTKTLLDVFNGSNIVHNLAMESHVEKLIS